MNRSTRLILRMLAWTWASPNTLIGVLCLPLALWKGSIARPHIAIEAHGPLIAWILRRLPCGSGGASALTLGHVVFGQDQASLDATREHEHVHVRQCERWGPAFLPAYLGVSAYLLVRGHDAYRDNPFEREAYGSSQENSLGE